MARVAGELNQSYSLTSGSQQVLLLTESSGISDLDDLTADENRG
jgi:hypothetical protein